MSSIVNSAATTSAATTSENAPLLLLRRSSSLEVLVGDAMPEPPQTKDILLFQRTYKLSESRMLNIGLSVDHDFEVRIEIVNPGRSTKVEFSHDDWELFQEKICYILTTMTTEYLTPTINTLSHTLSIHRLRDGEGVLSIGANQGGGRNPHCIYLDQNSVEKLSNVTSAIYVYSDSLIYWVLDVRSAYGTVVECLKVRDASEIYECISESVHSVCSNSKLANPGMPIVDEISLFTEFLAYRKQLFL